MKRSMRVIAFVAAVLGLGAGVSAAQFRQVGGVGITVYDNVNFQGATVTLDSDVPDLRDFDLNDRITSLQVAPGESWEVCENTHYGGRCIVVSGSERDLRTRGWNDAISSMRRVQSREGRGVRSNRDDGVTGITVFDDVNFQGATVTFHKDVPDMRDFELNDRISSLEVAPGDSWELCENTHYAGRCVVVSGSDRDLRTRGWSDTISSMRRVAGREGRLDRDDRGGVLFVKQPQDEIVLFDRFDYRGAAQNVTGAAAGLGAFGNRAQSAQVLDGLWELCEGPRWSGRCVRISSSVPDLGRIGLRGVASVRPLDPTR